VVLVDQPADGGPAVDPGIHPMTERQNIALAGIAVSDLGINCPDPSHRRRFFTSTCTLRYAPGSAAGSYRVTSLNNQSDTMTESTPEDADSADLKAGASASRTGRLVTHDQKITQALEGLNQVPRNPRLEPVKIFIIQPTQINIKPFKTEHYCNENQGPTTPAPSSHTLDSNPQARDLGRT
jgi:hypothetical protein